MRKPFIFIIAGFSFLVVLFIALILVSNESEDRVYPFTISEEQKALAVEEIQSKPDVIQASISQNYKTLTLVIIVDSSVGKDKAKEYGYDFACSVKTIGPDTPCHTGVLDRGLFDYIVEARYLDNTLIVTGEKMSGRPDLTW